MLELHNVRPNCTKRVNLGKNNITKFTNMGVDSNGQARNYDFDPEYDLKLYIYSLSSRISEPFREYDVQYGYMYQETPSATYCFPVFREVPTEGKKKVEVWKVSDSNWDEMEVVKVSSNFYAYSLPENRDLNKFVDGVIKVIDDYKVRLTEKYNHDIANQNNIRHDIVETIVRMMDDQNG